MDALLLRKSAPDSTFQPDWLVHRTRLSFSPKHNHWSSALKPNFYWWTGYISLMDPYHQHVISIFNTCSRWSTHQSLTDTDRSYNHKGAGLPHPTSQPSQPMVLHFPPKGPARSKVIKYQHKPLAILRVKHLAAEWPPFHLISTELTTMPSSMLTAFNY
jgi:hypothetical protein